MGAKEKMSPLASQCRSCRSLMRNAHNSITEMHSALRLDGFTQAKRLGRCYALV